jgi:hypothetical protein
VSVVNRGPETNGPPGQNFSHSVGILDSDYVNRQASHPCAASALNGNPRVVKFSHGKLNPPRLHTDLKYTPRPRPETLQGCPGRQVGLPRLLPFSPFGSAVVSTTTSHRTWQPVPNARSVDSSILLFLRHYCPKCIITKLGSPPLSPVCPRIFSICS